MCIHSQSPVLVSEYLRGHRGLQGTSRRLYRWGDRRCCVLCSLGRTQILHFRPSLLGCLDLGSGLWGESSKLMFRYFMLDVTTRYVILYWHYI